jgi:HEAT repeat protein
MPKSADMPKGKTNGHDQSTVPDVPASVIKDLDSPDAHVRFQALNYWTKPESTASLEPLFVALEDEDEAVRAKATEIVEARWAIEQERERN